MRLGTDLEAMIRGHASLADGETRNAFVHTLRSIVEPAGQRITPKAAVPRRAPCVLIWGERDRSIPVAHGRATHERLPGSRLEVPVLMADLDDPGWSVDVLDGFIDSTGAAQVDGDSLERDGFRQAIRCRARADAP